MNVPLRIENATLVASEGGQAFQPVVRVRNTSSELIVAYVIDVTYKLSNGKAVDGHMSADHRALGKSSPADSAIAPGSTAEPVFSKVRFSPGVGAKSMRLTA